MKTYVANIRRIFSRQIPIKAARLQGSLELLFQVSLQRFISTYPSSLPSCSSPFLFSKLLPPHFCWQDGFVWVFPDPLRWKVSARIYQPLNSYDDTEDRIVRGACTHLLPLLLLARRRVGGHKQKPLKPAGAPTGVIKDPTWKVMTCFSGIQDIMY